MGKSLSGTSRSLPASPILLSAIDANEVSETFPRR